MVMDADKQKLLILRNLNADIAQTNVSITDGGITNMVLVVILR